MKKNAPYLFIIALVCFASLFLEASLANGKETPNEQCLEALGDAYDSIDDLSHKFDIETRIMRDDIKYRANELRTTMGLAQPQSTK